MIGGDLNAFGKLLVVVGLLLAAVGAVIWFFPKIPYIGRLPGDILIRKKNFTFYFPLGTLLLLNLVLFLIFKLLKK